MADATDLDYYVTGPEDLTWDDTSSLDVLVYPCPVVGVVTCRADAVYCRDDFVDVVT